MNLIIGIYPDLLEFARIPVPVMHPVRGCLCFAFLSLNYSKSYETMVLKTAVEKCTRSFCFCLMSSDAKSILGTIYKVSFFFGGYIIVKTMGETGGGERGKLGPLADQYLGNVLAYTTAHKEQLKTQALSTRSHPYQQLVTDL